MIDIRPFAQLGGENHGWLNARHHFSFANYHDPERMHWGTLRVWNDDEIAPHSGFPLHPHADMEIITYVREGAISHKDSLGNAGRTEAGDVQVMSAGSGIRHSEWNADMETARIFQICIMPETRGGKPSWGTQPFPKEARSGRFVTLASGMMGDAEALPIRANARVMGATIRAGETISLPLDPERHAYLVLAKGSVSLNNLVLQERDGAAITGETGLTIAGIDDAEIVLVDAA